MKFLTQMILVVLFAFQAWAEDATESTFVQITAKQKVAYDSVIVDSKKPTLVLLPGIFRGLNRSDKFIQTLIEKKINFVAIHFSTQPASVAVYKANQKTYFENSENITSKLFADEVQTVIEVLKINNPLIVTLSYSGSITQHLNAKKFPVVIDTSPIGRFDENDSDAAAAFKAWEQWLKLFPFGDAFAKNAKETTFRNYWSQVASKYSATDVRLATAENIKRMTDGYVGMAKAVEDYDMRKQDFTNSPRRVFILGENEDQQRKAIQLEAIEVYKKQTGVKAQPIIIKNAGHIIPNEQPEDFVEILSAMLKQMQSKN